MNKDKIQRTLRRMAPVAVGVAIGVAGTLLLNQKKFGWKYAMLTPEQLQGMIDEPDSGVVWEDFKLAVVNSNNSEL